MPAAYSIDVAQDERLVLIVTPQGDELLKLEISDPDRPDSVLASSPRPGEAVVAQITGVGTHQVRVTGTSPQGGSFVIETERVDGDP